MGYLEEQIENMKIATPLIVSASIAVASAFVPAPHSKTSTALNESLFKKVSNLDLWAPVSTSNQYGARSKKNLKTGKLTNRSYVPSGLTKAQYEQVRKEADEKKNAVYAKNVKKAGKFKKFSDFYTKRGTTVGGNWMNEDNRGHVMCKTKYDWSGETAEDMPFWR